MAFPLVLQFHGKLGFHVPCKTEIGKVEKGHGLVGVYDSVARLTPATTEIGSDVDLLARIIACMLS